MRDGTSAVTLDDNYLEDKELEMYAGMGKISVNGLHKYQVEKVVSLSADRRGHITEDVKRLIAGEELHKVLAELSVQLQLSCSLA